MRPVKRIIALMVPALALGLSGCISLLPEQEPSTLYRLSPTLSNDAPNLEGGHIVQVERPIAARALSGDRLAIEMSGGQLAYMSGANWVSPAPDLVQELIIDTIDLSVEGLTAARPEDGVSTRYEIHTELRHFEAIYDNGTNSAPLIKVAMRVRLIDEHARSLVGVRTVEGRQRADSNRQGAIVAAYNVAATQAASQLAEWAEGLLPPLED